jgi:hypothetical protein
MCRWVFSAPEEFNYFSLLGNEADPFASGRVMEADFENQMF